MTSSSYAAAAADGVDDVDADSKKLNSKRRSAPLFDTNNEVFSVLIFGRLY